MTFPPIMAQTLPVDPITPFIDQYGALIGLLLAAIFLSVALGLLALYRKTNSATTAQDVITKAFVTQTKELAELRAEVKALSEAKDKTDDRMQAQDTELRSLKDALKAATDKVAAQERELTDLRGKVSQLETERTARSDELKRETERAARLEKELKAASGELADLRGRVARLEGENSALRQVIDKLSVVGVKPPDPPPDPDQPPPTPPTARVVGAIGPDEFKEAAA